MTRVVGVRFKTAGKVYYFDPHELDLHVNDKVVLETARGLEFGEVVVGPKDIADEDVVQPLRRVIRKAAPEDEEHYQQNKIKAQEAITIGAEKITKHGLPMKLVDAEYTFDDNKLVFYFTAEGRVDFRQLVRDLASVFRVRIDLRQIGVRDEAKMLGGIGPCGRPLCCASFLGDFEPVSIRMAKDQNLSLNPGKISGICGRLMCCLKYESEAYRDKRNRPKCCPLQGDSEAGCGSEPARAAAGEETRTAPVSTQETDDGESSVESHPNERPKEESSDKQQDKRSERGPAKREQAGGGRKRRPKRSNRRRRGKRPAGDGKKDKTPARKGE